MEINVNKPGYEMTYKPGYSTTYGDTYNWEEYYASREMWLLAVSAVDSIAW